MTAVPGDPVPNGSRRALTDLDRPTANCRLGVLAFGDSITNGGGELQWGVALQSWALWVARATGLPFTSYAIDGARARDVVDLQIPAFEQRSPAAARYDVGALYIGVNDLRAEDWDAGSFDRDFRTALHFLRARCDRTLACTAPLDLGRPRAGAKVIELNALVERNARDAGVLLVDLSRFGARNHVMTDHIHPTAFGQVAIAERSLTVLAASGLPPKVTPSALIRYEISWWRRLRSDLTYVYRHVKVSTRAALARPRAAARPPPSPPAAAEPSSD